MAEGSVPGGQLCGEPPQQAHRNPSMAQCRQYSQLCGSPGSAPVPGEAGAGDSPRATGNSGTLAAPNIRAPILRMKLRRQTRCAMSRASRSTRASIELRMSGIRVDLQGVTRTVGVSPSGSTLLRYLPEVASEMSRGLFSSEHANNSGCGDGNT